MDMIQANIAQALSGKVKPRRAVPPVTVQLEKLDNLGRWQPLPRRHSRTLADHLLSQGTGTYRERTGS